MIKLYSPENEPELALIKSLFELEHINYYVLNDHFGTMKIGPKIDLLNMKTIYVAEEDFDFAKEILFDFLKNIKKGKHVAEQLTMGTGAVNNHLYTYGLPQVPWGGNKDSGYGRTHGLLGFQELVDIHHVHVDRGRYKRDPWWFPYDEQRLKGIRALMTFLFFKKYRKSFSVIKAVRK